MGNSYPVKIGTKLGVAAGIRLSAGRPGWSRPFDRVLQDRRSDGRSMPPGPARHPVQNRVDLYRAGSRPEHNLLSAILDLEWTRRGLRFRNSAYGTDQSDQTMSAVRRDACACAGFGGSAPSCTPVARNARGLIHSDPATPTDGCAASSVHQNRPIANPSPPSDDADRSIRDQPFSRYPGYRFAPEPVISA